MELVKLQQGSQEWLEHRSRHFNASDAPAMMSDSPYVKRNELIHAIKTGETKQFSEFEKKYILEKGHRFEALARALADDLLDDMLAPLVGKDGKFSASYDGLTICKKKVFEHKTLNKAIRATMSVEDLPIYYREQMEHQLMVCNGDEALFLATLWEKAPGDAEDEGVIYDFADDENGVRCRYKLVEEKHFTYYPDMELRGRIIDGWKQLQKEVDAYEPEIIEAEVVAAPIPDLPAIALDAVGVAMKTNLDAYEAAAKALVKRTEKLPATDQETADTIGLVEKIKKAEDYVDMMLKQVDVKAADWDEFRRRMTSLKKDLSKARINGARNIESAKLNKKTEMVNAASDALKAHIAALNAVLPKPFMPEIDVDFWLAIKGKSKPASMKNDVDALLAEKKIEAEKIAETIGANLDSFEQLAVGDDSSLFDDLDVLCLKDADSFTAIVKTRIAEHKETEAARIAQQKADDQARSDSEQAKSTSACADTPAATADGAAPSASPSAAEESAVAQPLRRSSPASSEQPHAALSLVPSEPDLRASIIADMETMTADEIKQMAHMRDRIMQQRQPAAA